MSTSVAKTINEIYESIHINITNKSNSFNIRVKTLIIKSIHSIMNQGLSRLLTKAKAINFLSESRHIKPFQQGKRLLTVPNCVLRAI